MVYIKLFVFFVVFFSIYVYNVVVSDSLSVSLINRQGFPPPFSLDGFFFDIIKDERR